MLTSAPVPGAASNSLVVANGGQRRLVGVTPFYALAGARWTDDLVLARAKEIGTASVPEACGTAHTSGIWPPVRPVSSEEPRPCSPPLTAPTAVEVMLVTGSECVRVDRVFL